MKKTAVLLAMALMMSLAVPAFAAIDLNGKVETKLELSQDQNSNEWGVSGQTGIEVKSAMKAAGGNQVRVGLELAGLNTSNFKDGKPEEDFAADYPSLNDPFVIKNVWLETEGAYWNGGPSVLTRVGDSKVEWNRLVGHLGNMRGMTVQGIEAGPIAARGFYAFERGAIGQPTMGLETQADIMGLRLGGMVTRSQGHGVDMAANASVEAMPGINIEGVAALDAEQNSLYRVNATVNSVPGMTLKAGYRGYNDFAPAFADYKADRETEKNAYDTHTGFNVGIETEQAGITLAADYDDPTSTATVKAETQIEQVDVWASTKLVDRKMDETKFGAKRVFPIAGMDIVGEYEGKITAGNDAVHTLKAGTTLNMIRELEGLGVNGQIELNGTELASWKAGATYSAPNGINLGAEYDSETGPAVTAGLKASF